MYLGWPNTFKCKFIPPFMPTQYISERANPWFSQPNAHSHFTQTQSSLQAQPAFSILHLSLQPAFAFSVRAGGVPVPISVQSHSRTVFFKRSVNREIAETKGTFFYHTLYFALFFTHTYTHILANTHKHILAHISKHSHTHICTHISEHTQAHAHTHAHTQTYIDH